MSRSLHVRLDDDAESALATLKAQGLNDSDAVRTALREAAAKRRTQAGLHEEVARLMADPDDVAEMRAVRAQMDDLTAPWPPG